MASAVSGTQCVKYCRSQYDDLAGLTQHAILNDACGFNLVRLRCTLTSRRLLLVETKIDHRYGGRKHGEAQCPRDRWSDDSSMDLKIVCDKPIYVARDYDHGC